jgi:hypothetical protein
MPYSCIKSIASEHFGVQLTDAQAQMFVEREPGDLAFYVGAPEAAMDSAERELLGELIVREILGEGRWWPTYGDGTEAYENFKVEFLQAAPTRGFSLVDELHDTKKPDPEPIVYVCAVCEDLVVRHPQIGWAHRKRDTHGHGVVPRPVPPRCPAEQGGERCERPAGHNLSPDKETQLHVARSGHVLWRDEITQPRRSAQLDVKNIIYRQDVLKAVMELKTPSDGSSEWAAFNSAVDGAITAILGVPGVR